MQVFVAEPCGFCYGVKRAVEMAQAECGKGEAATLGPLIHNPQLIDELAQNGVGCKNSLDEFTGGTVIFRSHGVGPEIYAAAEEKGLGGCFLGTTTYNADQIIEVLKLPRLVVPIVTLTLGYPAEPLPSESERLPLAAIMHKECYKDYTPQSIDAFYKEKETLEVNKEFVRINNKETLAQVFTDIRYTKENCEHFSEVLMHVLKQQGFIS